MASFREKKGKWEYIVSAGWNPVAEKYDKITKSGFRTKTEARNAARRVEEELKQGTYIKESKTTFGEFMNVWIKHYEKRAKISSVRARSIAGKQLLKEWEHYPISSITMTAYQQHLDAISERVSPNYLDSIHTTGRMIFTHAEKQGLISQNPTKHFEKPRMIKDEVDEEDEQVENFLEREELQAFLMLAKEEGLRGDLTTFTVLAYSGMRIGELLALKESDLNLKSNEISISKTYYNPKNNKRKYSLLRPKTSKSIRAIELDPFVMEMVKSHIKMVKEEKLKNRMIYHDEGFVFPDMQGYPQTVKQISNRLKRLMQRMDTNKHITPHSFRHTNISLMIEANVPIGEIQRRVGHNSIETTMNIYAHMTKQTQGKGAQMFSSHLSELTAKLQN